MALKDGATGVGKKQKQAPSGGEILNSQFYLPMQFLGPAEKGTYA